MDLLPLGLSPRHHVIVTRVSTLRLELRHVQTARRGSTRVRQRRRARRLAWRVRLGAHRRARVMPSRIACLLLATRDTRARTEARARLAFLELTKSREVVRRAATAEGAHTRPCRQRRRRRLVRRVRRGRIRWRGRARVSLVHRVHIRWRGRPRV